MTQLGYFKAENYVGFVSGVVAVLLYKVLRAAVEGPWLTVLIGEGIPAAVFLSFFDRHGELRPKRGAVCFGLYFLSLILLSLPGGGFLVTLLFWPLIFLHMVFYAVAGAIGIAIQAWWRKRTPSKSLPAQ